MDEYVPGLLQSEEGRTTRSLATTLLARATLPQIAQSEAGPAGDCPRS